ncbi:MAG: hypothetical protein HY269_02360 [Deltaproteobacteria bacterium]|nr:hypothetical protein [Deltaproteobacteria bacterium]
MPVHAKIVKVSHDLDEALRRIALPHYETSAMHEIDEARKFSARVVRAAFEDNIPHDYSAGKFSDDELAAQLPKFEGALRLAEALKKEKVTLPVTGTLLERVEAIVRAWLRERRDGKELKRAELMKARSDVSDPPHADPAPDSARNDA